MKIQDQKRRRRASEPAPVPLSESVSPLPPAVLVAAIALTIFSGNVTIARAGNEPAPSPATELTAPSTCLVVTPDGAAPEDGWPVFVLMHGYGTNKEDFSQLATVVANHGAAAISVDAPNLLGTGRRSWGPDIAATHRYLLEQIEPLRADDRFDFDPIHLGGFSQGGIRSLLLVAWYPQVYGGALSVSPAGGDWPTALPESTHPHPLRLVYGTSEDRGMIESARRAIDFWTEWQQPWESFTHPGGHHFPSDWVAVLGDGVDYILRGGESVPAP